MSANANALHPVANLRRGCGLSQEALARRVGCSLSTIRLVEHGYRPSEEMLTRIAQALGVPPEEVMPKG